jgi:holo-[acyl-carrier protein] synthase
VIIGMGNDICEIARVEKTLARHGERFTQRCFTQIERAKSDRRKQRAASYAKRFAAKEACAKALGTGMSRGVFWKDIGVINLPSGKPTIQLENGARRALERLVPDNHDAHIHITITDDNGMAQAFVIIEAIAV